MSFGAVHAAADVPTDGPGDAPPQGAPDAGASAPLPQPPVAPAAASSAEKQDPEASAKSNGQLWPSLVLEPGAGVVVAPRVRGAGMFGFSAGVVHLSTKTGSDEVRSLVAAHVGYTFAPRANRAELTVTVGRSLAGYFVLAVRGGPTVDTDGNFGFRAGLRGSALHVVGLELLVHHAFVAGAPETSVLAAFSIDLVPVTAAFLLVHALSGLLK